MLLQSDIDRLNPWYYPLKLGNQVVVPGIGSPHSPDELREREIYMTDLLVDQAAKHYDFKGKRLLDVGCNCGYWSSQYVSRFGAATFVGIEGRDTFVDQGWLYWNTNRFLPRGLYGFIHGDVGDPKTWDAVAGTKCHFALCAGILYHITNHQLVLANILEMAQEAVLIDTRVAEGKPSRGKPFEERGQFCFDAIPESRIACHPSLEWLESELKKAGMEVIRLRTDVPLPKDMQKNDNFDAGRRVALLGIRRGQAG